jgi:UPF0716 protein FxsA
MRLFLLFLLVQIGGLIGLWPTLTIVILTALVGTILVRSQGSAVISKLRGSFEELRDPTEPLAHGAMILFSGALLLTPGFFTDAVGFALLVPGVRSAVYKFVRERIKITEVRYGRPDVPPAGPPIIDAEYEDLDSPKRPEGPSGWTRH